MSDGFNVVDFMSLQPVERRIMRIILREISMTYLQLRDAVTTTDMIDEGKLIATLNQLTENQWLSQHSSEQQTHYRVNSLQRTSSQNDTFWNNLELDSIKRSWSLQLQPETRKSSVATRSGGKRQLPACIWDCLDDDAAPKGQ